MDLGSSHNCCKHFRAAIAKWHLEPARTVVWSNSCFDPPPRGSRSPLKGLSENPHAFLCKWFQGTYRIYCKPYQLRSAMLMSSHNQYRLLVLILQRSGPPNGSRSLSAACMQSAGPVKREQNIFARSACTCLSGPLSGHSSVTFEKF